MVPEVSPRLAQVLTLARMAVLLRAPYTSRGKLKLRNGVLIGFMSTYWVINAGNSAVTAEQVVISTSYYGH